MAPSKQDRWLPNWIVQNSPHALERERESGTNLEKDDRKKRWMCLQTLAFHLHIEFYHFSIFMCTKLVGGGGFGMGQSAIFR